MQPLYSVTHSQHHPQQPQQQQPVVFTQQQQQQYQPMQYHHPTTQFQQQQQQQQQQPMMGSSTGGSLGYSSSGHTIGNSVNSSNGSEYGMMGAPPAFLGAGGNYVYNNLHGFTSPPPPPPPLVSHSNGSTPHGSSGHRMSNSGTLAGGGLPTVTVGAVAGLVVPPLPPKNSLVHHPDVAPKVDPADKGPKQLIINYLAPEVQVSELFALFEQFGPVECARILLDKQTGGTKGFGFVYFAESAHAATAIKYLQGFELYGKYLRIGFAVPQRASPVAPPRPQKKAEDEEGEKNKEEESVVVTTTRDRVGLRELLAAATLTDDEDEDDE